jgi:hypothetical protein
MGADRGISAVWQASSRHARACPAEGVDGRDKPGHDVVEASGAEIGGRSKQPYFAFSIRVTMYPEAASSASKVTLSPTLTCLSTAGSLTR